MVSNYHFIEKIPAFSPGFFSNVYDLCHIFLEGLNWTVLRSRISVRCTIILRRLPHFLAKKTESTIQKRKTNRNSFYMSYLILSCHICYPLHWNPKHHDFVILWLCLNFNCRNINKCHHKSWTEIFNCVLPIPIHYQQLQKMETSEII